MYSALHVIHRVYCDQYEIEIPYPLNTYITQEFNELIGSKIMELDTSKLNRVYLKQGVYNNTIDYEGQEISYTIYYGIYYGNALYTSQIVEVLTRYNKLSAEYIGLNSDNSILIRVDEFATLRGVTVTDTELIAEFDNGESIPIIELPIGSMFRILHSIKLPGRIINVTKLQVGQKVKLELYSPYWVLHPDDAGDPDLTRELAQSKEVYWQNTFAVVEAVTPFVEDGINYMDVDFRGMGSYRFPTNSNLVITN